MYKKRGKKQCRSKSSFVPSVQKNAVIVINYVFHYAEWHYHRGEKRLESMKRKFQNLYF